MVASLVLLTLLVIAALTDLREHKIYNWTTYSGIVVALSLAMLASFTGNTYLAAVGVWQSLYGLGVCGGLMLVCFACFQIGGGDVKLLAMIGAFLGPEFGLQVLLWTFVLGAIAAVILLAWKLGVFDSAIRVVQQIYSRVRLGYWQPRTDEEQRHLQLRLYLAPYALLAFGVVWLSPLGGVWG